MSTSSSSSSKDSSSSSAYCFFPACVGNACASLTNWYLLGVDYIDTDNGLLFVKLVSFPATDTQQVEIYKDNTYFNLVAIGQEASTIATTILLEERNSSGISGSVDWDGMLLDYSYTATLFCEDFSTSSSSSSKDSSSTSEGFSNSSSSSQCCNSLFCEGAACANFSLWTLSGLADKNSTRCSVYVGLETSGAIQQVRLYKEPELITLVSVGQRTGAGLIALIEQNGSGLTGTVTYDGTLLPYPNTLTLSCLEFSSSSSSSSSSVDSSSSSSINYSGSSVSFSTSSSTSSKDSSSSSSSLGYTESSDSSLSQSSSSSPTSVSSSSSSSVDSSSTSSESEGNFSSSSSSSLEVWNQVKPLVLGLSSATASSQKNRIAQTIFISSTTYDVGKLYCYFYEARGQFKDYYIQMEIYDCDANGTPDTSLFSQSILASTVNKDGWYSFEFDLTGETTPANGYISFVLSHFGDENNYVLWGYCQENPDDDTIAWTSDDSVVWDEFDNAVMSIKVVGNFNPFDSTTNTLSTPPTNTPIQVIDPIVDGEIEYNDLICSFVVDSSGSMGLTDRYNNRRSLVDELVDKFKDNYPSDIKFDFFSFGGAEVDLTTVTSGLGRFESINLDLTVPTRTTYVFSVTSAQASEGAVYENNGASFIVQQTLQGGDTLITFGDSAPINAGTLTLTSGTGDPTIQFGSFIVASIADAMIAYGFHTFENTHLYNVGELLIDNQLLGPVSLNNWQLFNPSSESPTITEDTNGPGDSASIDIGATQNLVSRKVFSNVDIKSADILSILEIGATQAIVSDASDFNVGDIVDIVAGSSNNLGRTIVEILGTTVVFTPPVTVKISNHDTVGSVIQTSTYNRTKTISGDTANLYVRDVSVGRNISFYLQTNAGYYIEWELKPFAEWIKNNIYWLGETARLPLVLKELDGTPFPDGTKVELVVDQQPDIVADSLAESASVTQTSAVGDTKIYVDSLEGYSRDLIIDITDKDGNVQTAEVVELGTDDVGSFIEIAEPLIFEVSLESGSLVAPNQTSDSILPTGAVLALELSLVDVTPVVNDKSLDPSLLKPYDIDRVPPSTPYEDLNTAQEFIQKQTVDMPSIDGNAVVRVLPITEDILETVEEKQEDLNRNQRVSSASDIIAQLEQNEGDEETATSTPELDAAIDESTILVGDDFTIETPVFTLNGLARSAMKSTASDLTEKVFEGISIPGVGNVALLSKEYTIYPSAEFIGDSGNTLSKIYLEPFIVDFVPPFYIDSDFPTSPSVGYLLADPDSDEGCFGSSSYNEYDIQGVYASGDGTVLNYIITDELLLAKNKTLNVTIYTNRVADLDSLASDITFDGGTFTQQFVNIEQPSTVTVDDSGNAVVTETKTQIDLWREIAQNNPFAEIISDTGETDDSPSIEGVGGYRDSIISQYSASVGGSFESTTTGESVNVFYKDPLQWTLAEQYAEYTFSIPIVSGKASIVIPSNNTVSLLMVEASVSFGDLNENEQLRTDLLFVANPIRVGGISPSAIIPAENEVYEIGVQVLFGDGTSTIVDNTTVNFTLDTNAEPSTSSTDNGWAGGIFIGPHAPIPSETLAPDVICPPSISETVNIDVFHSSGYVRNVNRTLNWYGKIDHEDTTDNFIFFASDATTASWSDGSVAGGSTITSNLDDDFNPTDIFVGEEGVDKLQGEDQPNGIPRPIRSFGVTPAKATWENGVVEFLAEGLNKNIGNKQPLCQGEKLKEPWDRRMNAVSSYRQESGTFRRGEIASGLPFIGASGGIVIPKPILRYKEPLGITIEMETAFTRNGVSSPIVVADITWKGESITNRLIINGGSEFETTIQFPFPTVTFQSGTCEAENSSEGDCAQMIDTRNTLDGCVIVAPHQSCQLTTYAQQAGLVRTTSYTDGTNIHKHVTEVDSDGNGTTTSTVTIFGTVSSHTHVITDYVVDEADGHTHDLRCVAVTQLLPTDDIVTSLVVNSYVIYDPTNAEPYEQEPSVEGQNRMMFSSLRLPSGSVLDRELVIQLEIGNDLDTGNPIYILDFDSNLGTAPTFYTGSSIEDTARGFDIRAVAKFAEYVYLDGVGNEVFVPEESIEDGSRVTVEITPFKPESLTDSTDVGYPVMAAGLKRDYMTLKIKVAVGVEGYFHEKEVEINVVSISQWFPSVKHLVPTLTDDDIYISEALDKFGYFGSSQIHDAVKKAAQQLIQYQTDDSAYLDYKKMIILLTDGDENTSESSLNQAVNSVHFIDGFAEVPVIPVQLGQVHSSDSVILEKYATETGGIVQYLNDSNATEISEVADSIVTVSGVEVNKTLIKGSIIFADSNLPETVSLNGATVPVGASVQYRIRTSIDCLVFTDWTDFMDVSEVYEFDQSIESLQKCLEYEVLIEGSSSFDSPVINGGLAVDYFAPRDFVVFFQPIALNLNNDEYVSSIHVTHEADIPESSTVGYLITQSDSLEIDDYIQIVPDQHTIIPTRFNELLLTTDYKTYTAINKRWHTGATVEVWRISQNTPDGELVDVSEYSANSIDGTILFLSAQDVNDVIFINVYFGSNIRLAAQILNYSEDAAVIHHIGVQYNVMKRIPRSSDGTIISVPISNRLP